MAHMWPLVGGLVPYRMGLPPRCLRVLTTWQRLPPEPVTEDRDGKDRATVPATTSLKVQSWHLRRHKPLLPPPSVGQERVAQAGPGAKGGEWHPISRSAGCRFAGEPWPSGFALLAQWAEEWTPTHWPLGLCNLRMCDLRWQKGLCGCG